MLGVILTEIAPQITSGQIYLIYLIYFNFIAVDFNRGVFPLRLSSSSTNWVAASAAFEAANRAFAASLKDRGWLSGSPSSTTTSLLSYELSVEAYISGENTYLP